MQPKRDGLGFRVGNHGAHLSALEGGHGVTHNDLRLSGRFRCLVIFPGTRAWLLIDTYRILFRGVGD